MFLCSIERGFLEYVVDFDASSREHRRCSGDRSANSALAASFIRLVQAAVHPIGNNT